MWQMLTTDLGHLLTVKYTTYLIRKGHNIHCRPTTRVKNITQFILGRMIFGKCRLMWSELSSKHQH